MTDFRGGPTRLGRAEARANHLADTAAELQAANRILRAERDMARQSAEHWYAERNHEQARREREELRVQAIRDLCEELDGALVADFRHRVRAAVEGVGRDEIGNLRALCVAALAYYDGDSQGENADAEERAFCEAVEAYRAAAHGGNRVDPTEALARQRESYESARAKAEIERGL